MCAEGLGWGWGKGPPGTVEQQPPARLFLVLFFLKQTGSEHSPPNPAHIRLLTWCTNTSTPNDTEFFLKTQGTITPLHSKCMKSSTSGLCPECAHIHPRQEPGWPASWVAEAAALSCRQDFRPLHQLGPENKLLTHFPAPTQPRSPRGEPEAHTPAAAYTKPLITTKGLSRNPWRLRCLQKGLCWLRAIHVGRVRSIMINYSQDRLATHAVNFGSIWLCDCSGWEPPLRLSICEWGCSYCNNPQFTPSKGNTH